MSLPGSPSELTDSHYEINQQERTYLNNTAVACSLQGPEVLACELMTSKEKPPPGVHLSQQAVIPPV